MTAKNYIDSKIQELELQIEGYKKEKNNLDALPDTYNLYKVGCSENNSGGDFWLNTEDYKGLIKEGFKVFPKNRAFYKIVSARNEHEATMMVKADFNAATRFDADDEGCNCCGQPFWFETTDSEFYWEDMEDPISDLRGGINL